MNGTYNYKCPKGSVKIPPPTQEDLEWVKVFDVSSLRSLDRACELGQLWRIQHAVEIGANILNNNNDPLRYAANAGQVKAVRLLTANGASVKNALRNSGLNERGEYFLKTTHVKSAVWKKIDNVSIAKLERQMLPDDAFTTIRTVFNFKSRKITVYTEMNGSDLGPMRENFKDQETDIDITEAHENLVQQGGIPPELGVVLNNHVEKKVHTLGRLNPKNSRTRG